MQRAPHPITVAGRRITGDELVSLFSAASVVLTRDYDDNAKLVMPYATITESLIRALASLPKPVRDTDYRILKVDHFVHPLSIIGILDAVSLTRPILQWYHNMPDMDPKFTHLHWSAALRGVQQLELRSGPGNTTRSDLCILANSNHALVTHLDVRGETFTMDIFNEISKFKSLIALRLSFNRSDVSARVIMQAFGKQVQLFHCNVCTAFDWIRYFTISTIPGGSVYASNIQSWWDQDESKRDTTFVNYLNAVFSKRVLLSEAKARNIALKTVYFNPSVADTDDVKVLSLILERINVSTRMISIPYTPIVDPDPFPPQLPRIRAVTTNTPDEYTFASTAAVFMDRSPFLASLLWNGELTWTESQRLPAHLCGLTVDGGGGLFLVTPGTIRSKFSNLQHLTLNRMNSNSVRFMVGMINILCDMGILKSLTLYDCFTQTSDGTVERMMENHSEFKSLEKLRVGFHRTCRWPIHLVPRVQRNLRILHLSIRSDYLVPEEALRNMLYERRGQLALRLEFISATATDSNNRNVTNISKILGREKFRSKLRGILSIQFICEAEPAQYGPLVDYVLDIFDANIYIGTPSTIFDKLYLKRVQSKTDKRGNVIMYGTIAKAVLGEWIVVMKNMTQKTFMFPNMKESQVQELKSKGVRVAPFTLTDPFVHPSEVSEDDVKSRVDHNKRIVAALPIYTPPPPATTMIIMDEKKELVASNPVAVAVATVPTSIATAEPEFMQTIVFRTTAKDHELVYTDDGGKTMRNMIGESLGTDVKLTDWVVPSPNLIINDNRTQLIEVQQPETVIESMMMTGRGDTISDWFLTVIQVRSASDSDPNALLVQIDELGHNIRIHKDQCLFYKMNYYGNDDFFGDHNTIVDTDDVNLILNTTPFAADEKREELLFQRFDFQYVSVSRPDEVVYPNPVRYVSSVDIYDDEMDYTLSTAVFTTDPDSTRSWYFKPNKFDDRAVPLYQSKFNAATNSISANVYLSSENKFIRVNIPITSGKFYSARPL